MRNRSASELKRFFKKIFARLRCLLDEFRQLAREFDIKDALVHAA